MRYQRKLKKKTLEYEVLADEYSNLHMCRVAILIVSDYQNCHWEYYLLQIFLILRFPKADLAGLIYRHVITQC